KINTNKKPAYQKVSGLLYVGYLSNYLDTVILLVA
ncbi:MAG: hypothetical protein ACI95K_001218, partial [Lentimonas sp.]